MTTVATPLVRKLADDWENALPSAVLSGIVGDPAHMAEGGYHVSREDQPNSGDYSIQLAEDRGGPSNAASAIDMNHSASEMILVTQRLLNSAKDQNDPRLNYMREFYGTVDGKNVTGWDTYYGSARTSDRSHLWHIHISILRKYVNDPEAMRAILSVIKGETTAQWRNGGGGGTVAKLGDLARLGDDNDGAHLIWRMEAIASMRDAYAGGPQQGQPVYLVAFLKEMRQQITAMQTELAAIKAAVAKVGAPTDAQVSQLSAKLSADLKAVVGVAVVDELKRELTD